MLPGNVLDDFGNLDRGKAVRAATMSEVPVAWSLPKSQGE